MATAILRALHLAPKPPVSIQPDARSSTHFSKWIDERLDTLHKEVVSGSHARTFDDLQEFWRLAEQNIPQYDVESQEKLKTKLTKWKTKIVATQKKKFLAAYNPYKKNLQKCYESLNDRRQALQDKMVSLHLRGKDAAKVKELKPITLPSMNEFQDQELRIEAIFHQIEFLRVSAPAALFKELEEIQTNLAASKNTRYLLEKAVSDVTELQELAATHQRLKEELPALSEQASRAENALNELIVVSFSHEQLTRKCAELQQTYDDLTSAMKKLEDKARRLTNRYPHLPLLEKVGTLIHKSEEHVKKFKKFQTLLATYNSLYDWLTRKTDDLAFNANNLNLIEESDFEIPLLQQAIKYYLTPIQIPNHYHFVNHLQIVQLLNKIPKLKTEGNDPEYQALIQKTIITVQRAKEQVNSPEKPALSVGQWILSLFSALWNWICSFRK